MLKMVGRMIYLNKASTIENQNTQDLQLATDNIFRSQAAFNLATRMATAFSSSTIVPKNYQNNPSNCLIALEMANRIGTSPLMVMQNLYIVNGQPAWSSQFIVAMINNSGKYKTELQYDLTGNGDDLSCYAYIFDRNDRKVVGPTISMKMAKAEGWYDKYGSKWKTMPEVMIRYRAASFFGRLNCPDMIMGIYSSDEVIEISGSDYKFVDKPPVNEPVQEDFSQQIGSDTLGEMTGAAYMENGYASEFPETEKRLDSGNFPAADPAIKDHISHNDVPANGNSTGPQNSNICADCGVGISDAEHGYSTRIYGRDLCRKHQQEAKKAKAANGNGGGSY